MASDDRTPQAEVFVGRCPGCRSGGPVKLGRVKVDGATETSWACLRCWTEWVAIGKPGEPATIIMELPLIARRAAENLGQRSVAPPSKGQNTGESSTAGPDGT